MFSSLLESEKLHSVICVLKLSGFNSFTSISLDDVRSVLTLCHMSMTGILNVSLRVEIELNRIVVVGLYLR